MNYSSIDIQHNGIIQKYVDLKKFRQWWFHPAVCIIPVWPIPPSDTTDRHASDYAVKGLFNMKWDSKYKWLDLHEDRVTPKSGRNCLNTCIFF